MKIVLRPAVEVQRVHDLLHGLIELEGSLALVGVGADFWAEVHSAHSCLAWVLREDGGEAFAGKMRRIEDLIRGVGWTLEKLK